jgi:hypothetical protein
MTMRKKLKQKRHSRAAKVPASPADILTAQKELLETYDQASHAWIARAQSELDLWSELATKLATTRSVPGAMQAYQECVAKRMKLAADDGQQLLADSNSFIRTLTRSLSNGFPIGRA